MEGLGYLIFIWSIDRRVIINMRNIYVIKQYQPIIVRKSTKPCTTNKPSPSPSPSPSPTITTPIMGEKKITTTKGIKLLFIRLEPETSHHRVRPNALVEDHSIKCTSFQSFWLSLILLLVSVEVLYCMSKARSLITLPCIIRLKALHGALPHLYALKTVYLYLCLEVF